MTDKNTLREMSQDILVIPFSEEVAETLDRFCENQTEDMELERFEELTMSFLTRKNDEELTEAFDTFCQEEGLTTNLSEEAIIPVLAEYIVLRAIETADAKERALFSLLLKNALILAVKANGFVAYPKAIAETFDIYNNYLKENWTFGTADSSYEVTRSLLYADDDSLAEEINNADGDVLKAIISDAATYRYEEMVKNLKVDKLNMPKSIYITAKKLVEEAPWIYVDRAPAETIKKIFADYANIEIKLGEVIDCLKEIVEDEFDDLLTTSILLRLIDGDGKNTALHEDVVFKASELAVYLYYEMLAEAISKEKYDTEE